MIKCFTASAVLGFVGLTSLCFASVDMYCPHSQLCMHPPFSEHSAAENDIAINRIMAIPLKPTVSQTIEVRLNSNMYWAGGEPSSLIKTIPVQALPSRVSYCIHDKGCHSLLLVGVKITTNKESQIFESLSATPPVPVPEPLNPLSLLAQSLTSGSGFFPPLFRYVTQPPALPLSPEHKALSPEPEKGITPDDQTDQDGTEDSQPVVKVRFSRGLKPFMPVAQHLVGRILEGSVYLFFYGWSKQFFFIPVPFSHIEANELLVMSDEVMLSGSGEDQVLRVDFTPIKRTVRSHSSELEFNHPGPGLKSDQIVTRVLDPSGESQYVLIAGDQLITFTSKDSLERFLQWQAQHEETIDNLAEWVSTIGFRPYVSQGDGTAERYKNCRKAPCLAAKDSSVRVDLNSLLTLWEQQALQSDSDTSNKPLVNRVPIRQPIFITKAALTSALNNINNINTNNIETDIRFLTSTHFLQPPPQQVLVGIVVTGTKKNQYLAAINSTDFFTTLNQNVDIENLAPHLFTWSITSLDSPIHDISTPRHQKVAALFQILINGTADTAFYFAQALARAFEHSGHEAILSYLDSYREPGLPHYSADPVHSPRPNPPPATRQTPHSYNPIAYRYSPGATATYGHSPVISYQRHQPIPNKNDDCHKFSTKEMEAALSASLETQYQGLLTQLTQSSSLFFKYLDQKFASNRLFWQLLADSLATMMVRATPKQLVENTDFDELFELLRQPVEEGRLAYFNKHFIEGDGRSKPLLGGKNMAEFYLKLFQVACEYSENPIIAELKSAMWEPIRTANIHEYDVLSLVRTHLPTIQEFKDHGSGLMNFFIDYHNQLDIPLTIEGNVPPVIRAIQKALNPPAEYTLGDYHTLKDLHLSMQKVFSLRAGNKYVALVITLADLAPTPLAMAGKLSHKVLHTLKMILGNPRTPKRYSVNFAVVTDGRILPKQALWPYLQEQLNAPAKVHGYVKLASKIPPTASKSYHQTTPHYSQTPQHWTMSGQHPAHMQPQINPQMQPQARGVTTQPYDYQHYPEYTGWNKPIHQQPIHQQPVYQQPVYQQPVYQQTAYQQPVYQQPVYQQTAYQQTAYQQPAYQQTVYQQHAQQIAPAPAPSSSQSTRRVVTQVHYVLDEKTETPSADQLYSKVEDISFHLYSFRAKWRIIAYSLNMDSDTLDEIEYDTGKKDLLHKMLSTLYETYSPAENDGLAFNQYVYNGLLEVNLKQAAESLLIPNKQP